MGVGGNKDGERGAGGAVSRDERCRHGWTRCRAINRSGGEGTKIVIRGLEPKFNAITVNGVRMPANSANDRSVDLSLISPEMLDGIEVFKSPLPDMDGEAIGGTVNLKLRKAPSGLKMLGKLLGGYNNLNNDLKDYKGVFQVSDRVFNKN